MCKIAFDPKPKFKNSKDKSEHGHQKSQVTQRKKKKKKPPNCFKSLHNLRNIKAKV